MSRSLSIIVAVVCCAFLPGGSGAQTPTAADAAVPYASKARDNAARLHKYSWKMRVEVTRNGNSLPASSYQVRYDADGVLQKTPIASRVKPNKMRGFGSKAPKEKIQEFDAWTAKLTDLVKEYITPPPDVLADFFSRAATTTAADGTLEVTADNFLHEGDHVTFWIDKATNAAVRSHFSTALDQDAVEGNVRYAEVENGPTYPERVRVNAPSKKASAIIETYDYAKR
ncbi:MAG: hypothetical protein KBD01_11955 [Acidobacteria bacterium]|nr:hypothetical protein [Acidobacteriota bacterium]